MKARYLLLEYEYLCKVRQCERVEATLAAGRASEVVPQRIGLEPSSIAIHARPEATGRRTKKNKVLAFGGKASRKRLWR